MKVKRITNKDYNTCYSCEETYTNYYMFKLVPHIKFYKTHDTITFQNKKKPILCQNCLFKLFNELNNLEYPLLDGTHDHARALRIQMNIPPKVMQHIIDGERIQAIKEYRLLGGRKGINPYDNTTYWVDFDGKKHGHYEICLKEAKDQVDLWFKQYNKYKGLALNEKS